MKTPYQCPWKNLSATIKLKVSAEKQEGKKYIHYSRYQLKRLNVKVITPQPCFLFIYLFYHIEKRTFHLQL